MYVYSITFGTDAIVLTKVFVFERGGRCRNAAHTPWLSIMVTLWKDYNTYWGTNYEWLSNFVKFGWSLKKTILLSHFVFLNSRQWQYCWVMVSSGCTPFWPPWPHPNRLGSTNQITVFVTLHEVAVLLCSP